MRIPARERNLSRVKRIKKLWRKIEKAKKELIEEKMLLFFELGKELEDERMDCENKNYRLIAQKIYKSFEKSYPWIPINKDWKLGHFRRISVENAEDIA